LLDAASANDEAILVEHQVWGVEEVDVAEVVRDLVEL
jgi:hypothetical protein